MQGRLAILGTFVAFAAVGTLASQTAPANPPERRVTAQGARKAGGQQTNPQQSDAYSPDSASVDVQVAANEKQKGTDTEQENLDIQRKLVWFTGGLVIVGLLQAGTMIWQAGLLRGTLREIRTQAGHMERQTKILEDSVAAAQKSADATLAQFEAVKRTQRAQIRIEFYDLDLTFDEKHGGYPVFFKIIMDGSTRAYIIQQSIVADIPELPREDRRYWADIRLPVNFTPEMSPFEGFVLLRTNELPPELETNEAKIQLVRDHIRVVRVHGGIVYRDIFGDRWRLSIHRAWDYRVGMWVGTGSVPEDEHRQIKDQRTKDQSQPFEPANPN